MAWNKQDLIPESEIKVKVTDATVKFAKRFGSYLGQDDTYTDSKTGRLKVSNAKLTTSQLRKFLAKLKGNK